MLTFRYLRLVNSLILEVIIHQATVNLTFYKSMEFFPKV